MTAPQPLPRRRRPLGKPIAWDDADLDRLSQVTPDDVQLAGEWFREHAPREFRGLLDATEDEGNDDGS